MPTKRFKDANALVDWIEEEFDPAKRVVEGPSPIVGLPHATTWARYKAPVYIGLIALAIGMISLWLGLGERDWLLLLIGFGAGALVTFRGTPRPRQ